MRGGKVDDAEVAGQGGVWIPALKKSFTNFCVQYTVVQRDANPPDRTFCGASAKSQEFEENPNLRGCPDSLELRTK